MSEDLAPEGATGGDVPACPKCSGDMWDNRVGKRNPKAPDFKCKDKSCDGVIWPPRDGERRPAAAAPARGASPAPRTGGYTAPPRTAPVFDAPPPDDGDFTGDEDDELPF